MKSQWEIVKAILENEAFNWINIDYVGKSKQPLASWFRTQTGQTVEHVKKSHFMAERMVSSNTPSLLLTMARDTGSRNEKNEFDFRTLRLAELDPISLQPNQAVPSIKFCNNFEKWQEENLEDRPIFPTFASREDEAKWVTLFERMRGMEIEKKELSAIFSKLKKKLKKDKPLEQNGYRFFWKNPVGSSEKIVDENDNPIKTTPSPSLRLRLEPVVLSHREINESDWSVNKIVRLKQKIDELSKSIKDMVSGLRPYELGILERYEGDIDSAIKIQGREFKIDNRPGKPNYSYTEEDRKKVEDKIYSIKSVPKTRGSWACEEIAVPSQPGSQKRINVEQNA